MSTLSDVRGRPLYLENNGLDFLRVKTFIEDIDIQEPLIVAVVPIAVVGDLGQVKIDAAILEVLGSANATLSSALGRLYIQWQSDLEIVYLKELLAFAATTFIPTDIANLILWLDSDDASTIFEDSALTVLASIDDVVGGWTDKSTEGNDAIQPTTAKKPLYRTDGIEWDGTDDALVGTLTSTTDAYTVYITHDADIAVDSLDYLLDSATGRFIATQTATGAVVAYFDGVAFRGTIAAITGVQITTYLVGAATGEIRRNGASLESGLTYNDVNLGGDLGVGANNSALGSEYDGTIKEILFYEGKHDAAQITDVETYLNDKWSAF